MYEKVKIFGDKTLFSSRFSLILGIVGFFVAFFLIKNYFSEFLFRDYHESYYLELEEEAARIAQNHDFNSDYKYDLEYNNRTKKMVITLYSDDDVEKVTLSIRKYDTSKEKYTIRRDIPSKEVSTKLQTIMIVLISIIISLLFELFLGCIYIIVILISLLYDYISATINSKSNN